MPGNSYKPLKTDLSRVFLISGRARPDHAPEYFSQLKLGAMSQSFGDVTKIEIPDPNRYGSFIEVDRIRGAIERATTQLIGRYAADLKSRLLELARQGCAIDVQAHFGECTDPSAFNIFSKGIIIEDVVLTTHSTDELGALGSDERASVNETVDISATDYYEVLPLTMSQRGGDIVTNKVNDVTFFDLASCGTCGTESDGCQAVFAVTNGAGGSPTTPPDLLFSFDSGKTWKAHDIDTFATAANANLVFGIGDYIVVGCNSEKALAYASIQDIRDGIDPSFTELAALGRGPNHAHSFGRKAFIVGDFGFVWYTEDITSGVTVLDAGVATIANLNDVSALDQYNVVAVGNDGAVIYTRDGVSFEAVLKRPTAFGVHLTGVHMKDMNEWWVTAANGTVWYTLNAGKSWTQKVMPGTTPSKMNSIHFSRKSIGYASGIVGGAGKMYRTFDGGYSWIVLPEGIGSMPTNQELVAIHGCTQNPNLVIGVGLGVATDGIIVTGRG